MTDSVNPRVERVDNPEFRGDARELLATARRALATGDFDEAVRCAEDLLDRAVWEHDPVAIGTLASAMPFLDSIFSARVGPRTRLVTLGAPSASMKSRLSLQALELISRIGAPMPLGDVIKASAIPDRDCVRLLAGLLMRRVLVEWNRAPAR